MIDPALAPASLSPGTRVYAVGDVHGCLSRLMTLHSTIAADLAERPIQNSTLVHLGDYVDRGPDSAGVVSLLSGTVAIPVTRRADLRGNHETMMSASLSGNVRAADVWLQNGGDATLQSYGARPDGLFEDWLQDIPGAHRHWIETRELIHQEGGYLFVHAGIRPGKPPHQQTDDDLLWIREPFLSSSERHPFVVVHGHTPAAAPSIHANRIGIDTGAVMGGVLTCLVLEENRMHFLTA